MRKLIHFPTDRREVLVDITAQVNAVVARSGVRDGLVALYAQGAIAALMIQENWDDSVPLDVIALMRKLIPKGVWLHDRQDGNGDAHLKSGLVGPSETPPLIDGPRCDWKRGRERCGSFLAYADVGKGREQDAEALPTRM